MAYGYGGTFSAIAWLEALGEHGLSSLTKSDRHNLQEAGILSEKGDIIQTQLDLALKHEPTGGSKVC